MGKTTAQYIREYKWSNIFAMIRNNAKAPKRCTDRFDGKCVLITGASSGIGYVTARKYAAQGANLICVNRNRDKSEKLKLELEGEFGISCSYFIADLSCLAEVVSLSNELAKLSYPIDLIIHNAGVYLTRRELTPEGFEKVFAVHYLSSFIMNYILMDKLMKQDRARIIMVGSEGHRFAAWGLRLDDLNWDKRRYSGLKSYGSAKLAQLLSMIIFKERFQGSGLTINTMHPGAVKTNTGQENGRFYRWFKRTCFDRALKSSELSAEALYYLGVSREMEGVSGAFYNLTTREEPAPPALDRELAGELWKHTLKITGLA
ncbi:MAG: short-chain dehydrogenase [Candidatus Cloacimonetes bacterium HGW-Cloacimonetes-2]|jgi:NAD(P)-dependent dehydrogenase (short-subunit alcohol dehydrogenase family)|nr:MAG: short-chain dehydrogenase [Candidatus Cloacimonetes bacterium HGW-Cloacimonetes-2]